MTDEAVRPNPIAIAHALLRADVARTNAEKALAKIVAQSAIPLPVPALPTRVDDLDSDTYDALRSRYAWLEQRHRDTAHSELAAINVRQAMEIGELRATLREIVRLFRQKGHPGYEARQSCWVPVADVERWQAIAYPKPTTSDESTETT